MSGCGWFPSFLQHHLLLLGTNQLDVMADTKAAPMTQITPKSDPVTPPSGSAAVPPARQNQQTPTTTTTMDSAKLEQQAVEPEFEDWKPGKQELAVMGTLAVISLMVALDATILVSVLPVRMFISVTDEEITDFPSPF